MVRKVLKGCDEFHIMGIFHPCLSTIKVYVYKVQHYGVAVSQVCTRHVVPDSSILNGIPYFLVRWCTFECLEIMVFL